MSGELDRKKDLIKTKFPLVVQKENPSIAAESADAQPQYDMQQYNLNFSSFCGQVLTIKTLERKLFFKGSHCLLESPEILFLDASRLYIRACVRPSVRPWVMLLLRMQEKASSAQFYHCLSMH